MEWLILGGIIVVIAMMNRQSTVPMMNQPMSQPTIPSYAPMPPVQQSPMTFGTQGSVPVPFAALNETVSQRFVDPLAAQQIVPPQQSGNSGYTPAPPSVQTAPTKAAPTFDLHADNFTLPNGEVYNFSAGTPLSVKLSFPDVALWAKQTGQI